jgi:hypothetical protein
MDRTEKPAIITRMAECLHHGERLVVALGVSIMTCPIQFQSASALSKTYPPILSKTDPAILI